MSYELRWGACKAFFYPLKNVPGLIPVVDEVYDALTIVEGDVSN